ncbi:hypothetical protein ACFX1Q_028261 [Malus domestica]
MQISMKNIRDFRQRRILRSGKASAESQAVAVTRTMWQPKHSKGCLHPQTFLLRPHTRGNDQKSFGAAAFQTWKQVSISNVLLTNEIMMMRKIVENVSPHPNVIDLPDEYEDKTGVHLVLELCSGGELCDRNRIVKQERYCEAGAAAVVRQTAQGLAALHSSNIVHRDLKPEMCLFLNNTNNSPLKIMDFRLSSVEEFTDHAVGLFGSIDCHQSLFLRDWSLLRATCGLFLQVPTFYFPVESAKATDDYACYFFVSKQLISDLLKVDHDKRPSAQEVGL